MPSGSTPNRQIFTKKPPSRKPCFINLRSPSRLDLEFAFEAAKGLGPHLPGVSKSPSDKAGVILSRQFFGCCLAVPKDASDCAQVVDLVRELGLGSIRLDLSYGQSFEQVEALLRALQACQVRVLLHVVPTLEAAARFPETAALAEFQRFLEDRVEPLLGFFEALELGSTINRVRWSGYDLSGFLAMWQVGHAFCQRHSILLVGPNVTDFEPQYNAGVLGMLKQRNQLPEIHSNNLFAERSVEPELADHKIMGAALRDLHGYDLRKKISLIAAISKRIGVVRNWSTCAFWTIPRIERYLSSPEGQMADYLVRYYVLCASVGSFERIFWGPLVSYREGLVDDCTQDRSSSDQRDVVAFYSAYPGDSAQWARRPAFHALRGLIQRLAGFRYHAALCARNGLEMHEFRKDDQVCVVAWTRNGLLARIKDCFASDSLESVNALYDREGSALAEHPDFITKSPTYFLWTEKHLPRVLKAAQTIPQVIVARPPEDLHYFDYVSEDWRGIVLAQTREEAARIRESLRPEVIADCRQEASLRQSRNAIWTVADPRQSAATVVVKKPRTLAWHKRLFDRAKPSKALRSWNGTCELMRRGIETPRVIAYFESTDPSRMLDNWFICERVSSGYSVRNFFTKYAAGAEEVEGYTFETFAAELLEFIRDMHLRGVYFRDLAGGNVLVTIRADRALEFSLIDTARARFSNRRFSRSNRVADLKRLVYKLDRERQDYFMAAYLKGEGAHFTGFYKFTFRLFAIKASFKRIKRKILRKFVSK